MKEREKDGAEGGEIMEFKVKWRMEHSGDSGLLGRR